MRLDRGHGVATGPSDQRGSLRRPRCLPDHLARSSGLQQSRPGDVDSKRPSALSVYASQPGSPPDHATLDSGWWPALTGQGSHLLGRIEGFRHVYPSTWLPLHQALPGAIHNQVFFLLFLVVSTWMYPTPDSTCSLCSFCTVGPFRASTRSARWSLPRHSADLARETCHLFLDALGTVW